MKPKFTWISANPVTQAYGLCVNNKGEVMIFYNRDHWSLPGGTTEGNESPEETLKRELLEEVDIEVKNVKLLGIQKVETSERIHYQLRFYCEIDKELPQTPDPDDNEIHERKWVPIEKINDYLKWDTESAQVMFEDLKILYNKLNQSKE